MIYIEFVVHRFCTLYDSNTCSSQFSHSSDCIHPLTIERLCWCSNRMLSDHEYACSRWKVHIALDKIVVQKHFERLYTTSFKLPSAVLKIYYCKDRIIKISFFNICTFKNVRPIPSSRVIPSGSFAEQKHRPKRKTKLLHLYTIMFPIKVPVKRQQQCTWEEHTHKILGTKIGWCETFKMETIVIFDFKCTRTTNHILFAKKTACFEHI